LQTEPLDARIKELQDQLTASQLDLQTSKDRVHELEQQLEFNEVGFPETGIRCSVLTRVCSQANHPQDSAHRLMELDDQDTPGISSKQDIKVSCCWKPGSTERHGSLTFMAWKRQDGAHRAAVEQGVSLHLRQRQHH
jgi:hypothetical protein